MLPAAGLRVTHLKKTVQKFLIFKPHKSSFSERMPHTKRAFPASTVKLHKKKKKDYEKLFLLPLQKYVIIKVL